MGENIGKCCIYLIRGYYPEYVKNFLNSITAKPKQPHFKIGNGLVDISPKKIYR